MHWRDASENFMGRRQESSGVFIVQVHVDLPVLWEDVVDLKYLYSSCCDTDHLLSNPVFRGSGSEVGHLSQATYMKNSWHVSR